MSVYISVYIYTMQFSILYYSVNVLHRKIYISFTMTEKIWSCYSFQQSEYLYYIFLLYVYISFIFFCILNYSVILSWFDSALLVIFSFFCFLYLSGLVKELFCNEVVVTATSCQTRPTIAFPTLFLTV